MDYGIIREICRVNKISLQTVAKEAGLTAEGLKRGFERDSLAVKYILPICKSLCISPNRLFGYEEQRKTVNQTQTGGVGNTQIVQEGFSALHEQLQEKDRQITKLLYIMENLTTNSIKQ